MVMLAVAFCVKRTWKLISLLHGLAHLYGEVLHNYFYSLHTSYLSAT